ncbi:MAG: substrate-binding domain-containing protein, partial [Pseudomonadota bacterium]
DREAGFLAGLAAHGATLHSRTVGDFHMDRAKTAARQMFNAPDRPDAVFVANDHMAIAVMDVLRSEMGVDIPGQVSVVGFDDVPPAAWAAYGLTTYRQRANRMVEETVHTLMTTIETGQLKPRNVTLPGSLILRTSARRPKDWTP